MEILIVGAGPTGLTAAVELVRHGLVPTVIDKRAAPSGLSRAVGITPSSLKILSASGVTDRLLQAGPPLKGVRAYFDKQPLFELNFAEHTKGLEHAEIKLPLLCLPQDKTENILADRLKELGGSVQYKTELVDLHQQDNTVSVTTSAGTANYDHVIGADGIGSTVRRVLGIAFDGYDLTERWSIADVDVDKWRHPAEFCAFLLSSGDLCVAAPIGINRVRVVANTVDALLTLPVPMHVTNVRRQANFRISIRQAQQFSKNRVYLAGDAAHCHSPVGGRGMNLGIADAAQLAACIFSNTTRDYHSLRHAQAENVIKMTERGRKLLTESGSLSRFIKPTVLRLANRSNFLKRRMIRAALDEE